MKGNKRRDILKGMAVGTGAVTLAGCLGGNGGGNGGGDGETLRIGVTQPQSGPYAAVGESNVAVTEAVLNQWSDETGVEIEYHIEDTETDKVTLAVQRQRRLGGGWRQTLFLRWERERFTQAGETGDSTLTLPGMSLTRTRSRGDLNPNWGDRQNLTVEATHPELGSDIQLARLRLGTKWLRTFGRHRFIARADAGGVASESFDQTPPSLRFFTGGDQSVRGFSYQSIAPENEDGELLGGRYLLVGGLEYGYRVLDNWTLATFYDAGDAFTDNGPEFKEGAGFGVRWASPVGPIRLDFAWGISEPDPPFRLHFSMGPEI